jgi:hypothetical protein
MQHVLAAMCERFVLVALPRGEMESTPGSLGDELPVAVMLRT